MNNHEILMNYLARELELDESTCQKEEAKMLAHEDILNELCGYLRTKKFSDNQIQESGFTAEILYKKYKKLFKTIYAAYNYLIYLREDPNTALQMLERGLPIK